MQQLPPLSQFLFELNEPCLFTDILRGAAQATDGNDVPPHNINSACEWTPRLLAQLFGAEQKLSFRMGRQAARIQFENECSFVEASVAEFVQWASAGGEEQKRLEAVRNPFAAFPRSEFWAYADYKYMLELDEALIDDSCIDWRAFGFAGRNAKDSTMWLGTRGAYTPCHYDAYGYNLVAQIHGTKRWTLFAPHDTPHLYATRVPFEESTIYSQVDPTMPDLERFPLFAKARAHVVELRAGQVLYVPHHWWHHVECLGDEEESASISINTWVELNERDTSARLREILSKSVLQGIMQSNLVSFEKWINHSENYTSQEENMHSIDECLVACEALSEAAPPDASSPSATQCRELVQRHPAFTRFIEPAVGLSCGLPSAPTECRHMEEEEEEDVDSGIDALTLRLASAATHPDVIELMARQMLANRDC